MVILIVMVMMIGIVMALVILILMVMVMATVLTLSMSAATSAVISSRGHRHPGTSLSGLSAGPPAFMDSPSAARHLAVRRRWRIGYLDDVDDLNNWEDSEDCQDWKRFGGFAWLCIFWSWRTVAVLIRSGLNLAPWSTFAREGPRPTKQKKKQH